jgi:hypothetical protein
MILSNVSKFPIVIIAPPRSGSSIICGQIGIDFNIRHYSDITYADDQNEVAKFLDFIQTTDQYVVKFHSFDMHKYPSWLTDKIFKGETYNVKVTRNNLLLNIASTYVARMRKLYHYDLVDVSDYTGPMPIKISEIIMSIYQTTKAVAELDALPVPFDEVVEYADHVYDEHVVIKTPLPSNYDEILKFIKIHYDIQQNQRT